MVDFFILLIEIQNIAVISQEKKKLNAKKSLLSLTIITNMSKYLFFVDSCKDFRVPSSRRSILCESDVQAVLRSQ